ncbi:MAG: hypothetical protein M3162_00425 [Thermoproteota archaeon]|nr:hypothetical protein [Thermoproteota archaeon]
MNDLKQSVQNKDISQALAYLQMAQRQRAELNDVNFETNSLKSLTQSMSSSRSSILSKIVADIGMANSPFFVPSSIPSITTPLHSSPFKFNLTYQPVRNIAGFPFYANKPILFGFCYVSHYTNNPDVLFFNSKPGHLLLFSYNEMNRQYKIKL